MCHCINRLLSIGVRKGGSWKETTEGTRTGTRKPESKGERSESEVEGARDEVARDGKDVWREGRAHRKYRLNTVHSTDHI